MRNSVEITRKYQFGFMLLHHLTTVSCIAIFELAAFWYFLNKPYLRQACAAVFIIVYGLIIYSYSRKLAIYDKKTYTPLKPELKWGVLWGVMISASIAVFLIMYKLNWQMFSAVDDTGVPYLTSFWAMISNMVFYLWTAPYFGLIDMQGGGIAVYAQIIMLAVPIIASTLGYKAGVVNFDLLGKLDEFTLEHEEDDE